MDDKIIKVVEQFQYLGTVCGGQQNDNGCRGEKEDWNDVCSVQQV